jgi:hypothetical protein
MYAPLFELESFDRMPLNRRLNALMGMLEGLIAVNYQYLQEYPSTPLLYEAFPSYVIKPRPFQIDSWQDIPTTLARGTGDCKDFAAWRVAELRCKGVPDVSAAIKTQMLNDLLIYHIPVRIGMEWEDPSRILGMPTAVTQQQLNSILSGR